MIPIDLPTTALAIGLVALTLALTLDVAIDAIHMLRRIDITEIAAQVEHRPDMMRIAWRLEFDVQIDPPAGDLVGLVIEAAGNLVAGVTGSLATLGMSNFVAVGTG